MTDKKLLVDFNKYLKWGSKIKTNGTDIRASLKEGKVLYTKDGRIIGNAEIVKVYNKPKNKIIE